MPHCRSGPSAPRRWGRDAARPPRVRSGPGTAARAAPYDPGGNVSLGAGTRPRQVCPRSVRTTGSVHPDLWKTPVERAVGGGARAERGGPGADSNDLTDTGSSPGMSRLRHAACRVVSIHRLWTTMWRTIATRPLGRSVAGDHITSRISRDAPPARGEQHHPQTVPNCPRSPRVQPPRRLRRRSAVRGRTFG